MIVVYEAHELHNGYPVNRIASCSVVNLFHFQRHKCRLLNNTISLSGWGLVCWFNGMSPRSSRYGGVKYKLIVSHWPTNRLELGELWFKPSKFLLSMHKLAITWGRGLILHGELHFFLLVVALKRGARSLKLLPYRLRKYLFIVGRRRSRN